MQAHVATLCSAYQAMIVGLCKTYWYMQALPSPVNSITIMIIIDDAWKVNPPPLITLLLVAWATFYK